jgi:insertion element IS1 protein InsB
VLNKGQKRWLWIALCRRTRQVVAVTIGDRSEKTCRRLWNKAPADYKPCQSYSDFWEAYQKVWPTETHHSVGKDSGETAHVERWKNTCDNASRGISAKHCHSRSPIVITGS